MEDAFPPAVRRVSGVSFPSSHGCPRRQDHCLAPSCFPPPLPCYDVVAEALLQNVAEQGLISSSAAGDLDVYLS